MATLPPPVGICEEIARGRNMVIAGSSNYVPRFINSLVIAFGSTFCAVALGTLAAYGFSRFKVPLADDLLFFILSTRMMPPIAVAIPIYLMYRELGLSDTRLGMILLYTSVNVSLAVWLLKGFIDEIPREYEEAAMVDGYTRFHAFWKVVLPQATTGIAATAIFCLIFAWNEYAFAVLLTSGEAQTAPPSFPSSSAKAARIGRPWRRERRCSWCRSSPSPCCCAGTCCAASPSARCASDARRRYCTRHGDPERSAAPVFPPRAVGGGGDCVDRCRCRHADAAVLADALRLLVRDGAARHGDVRRCLEISAVTIMAEIRVENLQKSFGSFAAVRGADFTWGTASSFACLVPRAAARRRPCG